MSTQEFSLTLLIGIASGWIMHSIVLQIAYRLGIVEYRGLKADHGIGGKK